MQDHRLVGSERALQGKYEVISPLYPSTKTIESPAQH
jgi:hypothetical protein